MVECSLCLDPLGQHVVTCFSGQHLFCRPCLTKYVAAECDCLKIRASSLITCPYVRRGQCASNPFTADWIRQHVDPATYTKYATVVVERDSTTPRSRPSPANVDEYRVEVIELLNPSCPQCRAAFIDFDGCCALSCRLCACRFCAFCQANDHADLHGHVQSCPYRDGDWRRGQLRWTRDRIVSLLKPLPACDQRQVLDGCRGYLTDLHIETSSLERDLGL